MSLYWIAKRNRVPLQVPAHWEFSCHRYPDENGENAFVEISGIGFFDWHADHDHPDDWRQEMAERGLEGSQYRASSTQFEDDGVPNEGATDSPHSVWSDYPEVDLAPDGWEAEDSVLRSDSSLAACGRHCPCPDRCAVGRALGTTSAACARFAPRAG